MQQFYEHSAVNSRKEIKNLFLDINSAQKSMGNIADFVPFSQERDKLGRLISREQNQRTNLARHSSLSMNPTKRSSINPQLLSDKAMRSDKRVEIIFKLNQVKGLKSSKSLHKMRILSSAANQIIQMPSIGYYDSAKIADKIKYPKSKQIPTWEPKIINKKQNNHIILKKVSHKIHEDSIQNNLNDQIIQSMKKTQIDYNLPQLSKYHQMKKLKMKLYDNFQADHLKFKELVRHSLVLANKIKKGLQLD